MSKPSQREVGPVTALVSIVVALLVVFMAYSILFSNVDSTDPAGDTAAQTTTTS